MTIVIARIQPSILNVNGDADNALVLLQRLRWSGIEASIIDVEHAADLPKSADAIILGSGVESTLETTAALLQSMRDYLAEHIVDNRPILAIGTGWELLSWGIERPEGAVGGLGLIAGRAVTVSSERIASELVVASPFGELVGFENHSRNFVGAEASPLGRVLAGHGNGDGSEGLRIGSVFGTHLHGPVLAKNPTFADFIIKEVSQRANVIYEISDRSVQMDRYASEIRGIQKLAAKSS